MSAGGDFFRRGGKFSTRTSQTGPNKTRKQIIWLMQFEFFQLLLHYWAAGCLLILEEQRRQLEGRWGGGTSFTIKITTIHRHTQKHLWTHRRHFYSFLHDDFTVIALIAVYFICPSSFTARTRAASLSLLLSHLHTYISPKLKTKYTWWERHTHAVKNDKKKRRE